MSIDPDAQEIARFFGNFRKQNCCLKWADKTVKTFLKPCIGSSALFK